MKSLLITIIILAFLLVTALYINRAYKEIKSKAQLIEKLKTTHIPEIKITSLDKMKDGDIVFQKSLSEQSEAIQLATHSEYTHCGIIYKVDNDYFVYEAVEPVKLTPLIKWMGKGKDGRFVVKRLKNADQILNNPTLKKLKQIGEKYKGKHYDRYFEWTNDRLYCSELVWKIYKEATGLEIGETQKLSDFDLTSLVVKQKMKERYGKKIPLNEVVISPSSIFNSELLTTIQEY